MSSIRRISTLRHQPPAILPSLLLCDFGRLAEEIRAVEAAGVEALHLDVMDGHFVPNLTYGLPIVEACRQQTELPLDVHLMIDAPEKYVDAFVDAGADVVTIHYEATNEPGAVLEQIHARGAAAGLAINPPTPFDEVAPLLNRCDLLLVMSVMPGFGGQAFDASALEKLSAARRLAGDALLLEVDGGVNQATIGSCVEAGADLLVAGSAIFRAENYTDSVRDLRERAMAVKTSEDSHA